MKENNYISFSEVVEFEDGETFVVETLKKGYINIDLSTGTDYDVDIGVCTGTIGDIDSLITVLEQARVQLRIIKNRGES